ncbi:MAG: RNA polymerase sigma-70 factor (ECF subfamily) [Candidatus Paceibacteria bacterium]|jgi:RNA polymerase sigma-70 factor (ECF subfamily)
MSEINVEQLLHHRQWLRRLASAIVGEQLADDVLQETWTAALATPPPHAENLQAWLARVVRRFAWKRLISEQHRSDREEVYAPNESLPAPEHLVACIEEQQLIAQAVAQMEEPYRSTLLWRYYEDLSLTDIARRAEVPESTVRSRVQRGLDRLRGHLEVQHGVDWRLAVLPLLKPEASGAVTTAAGSMLNTGGLLMTTQAKLLAACALALATLFVSTRLGASAPDEENLTMAVVEESPAEADPTPQVLQPKQRQLAQQQVSPETTQVAPRMPMVTVTVTVFDPTGKALEGVPLVSRPMETGGQATEVGVSNRAGELRFDCPSTPHEITCGEGYFTLYSTEVGNASQADAELFVIAAPEIQLSGRVEREDGSPLAEVGVYFEWWSLSSFPRVLSSVRPAAMPKTMTLEDGTFSLASSPGSGQLKLHFYRQGFQRHSLPCPDTSQENLTVTLSAHHGPSEGFRVAVFDEDGAALPQVLVRFGRHTTRSDESGEASLPWTRRDVNLVAVHPGKSPFVLERFGHSAWEALGSPDPMRIDLPDSKHEIRGRVFGPEGTPARGISVTIERGTPLAEGVFAEFIASEVQANSTLELARTDKDGRFVLRGLTDREYMVTAFDAESYACIRGKARPDGDEIDLHFPTNALLFDVDVICVDERGTPLVGLEVGVKLQVTYGIGGRLIRKALATTDEAGRFHLDTLPLSETWIQFSGPGILDTTSGVTQEQLDSMGTGPLKFELQGLADFRFVPSGEDPTGCSAALMREDSSLVSLWVQAKGTRMFVLTWDLKDGASPTYQVHAGEYTLTVIRGSEIIREDPVFIETTGKLRLAVP